MEIVNIDKKQITGLTIRTNNKAEMEVSSSKIPNLWDEAGSKVFPKLLVGSKVYGVYYNYESDVNGNYDLLVGSDKLSENTSDLNTVTIKEGKFLKFTKIGEIPKVCIDLWDEVWSYFESDTCQHTRLYTTDFEEYISDGVNIYIAVK